MTENLTLSQLGEQYLAESRAVDDRLAKCSKRLREAIKKSNSDEIIKLRRMIRLYYDQRSELRCTGKLLSEYYSKNERRNNVYYSHSYERGLQSDTAECDL